MSPTKIGVIRSATVASKAAFIGSSEAAFATTTFGFLNLSARARRSAEQIISFELKNGERSIKFSTFQITQIL
jgi:hypothetical protein